MVYIYLAALGACVGSFLNVVIYRMPLGRSIIRPGSACPKCGAAIKWHDNIPLFSYIILKGGCRHCGARISFGYPAIEAAAAAIILLDYWLFGFSWAALINLILSLGMLAVAVIDFEHMIIPDELSFGGIVVGLGLSLLPGGVSPLDAAIGAAAASLGLWLIRWGHMKVAGIEGMGLGDVKLAGAIGAFVGWYALPVVLFTSAASGLLIGGAVILLQRKGARTPIPFGVFLALGTVFYVMAQPWFSGAIAKFTLR